MTAALDQPKLQDASLPDLVRAGGMAPSFYNTQPWRIVGRQGGVDVFQDQSRESSLYDWGRFHSQLACGAVIENMATLCRAQGRVPVVEHQTGVSRMSVSSTPNQTTHWDQELAAAIPARHTNTLMFEDGCLGLPELNALSQAVTAFDGIELEMITDPVGKAQVFEAAQTAEQVRFSRRDLHEHLHHNIRWTADEATEKPTGYTLPSMGACGIGQQFFRFTSPWWAMRLAIAAGGDRNQAKQACRGLLHNAGVGLLTVRGQSSLGGAGQAMQRLWLTATALDLDLQPHNSIVLFRWICRNGGAEVFSPTERAVLTRAFERLENGFPSTRGVDGFFLFRVGHGERVHGRTHRRPLTVEHGTATIG